MTREEYDEHRRKLDDQLRVGVELLQAAHAAQVQALEVVWVGSSGGVRVADQAAELKPAPPQKAPRRHAYEMDDEVLEVLPQLPEVFTARDVCRLLGYKPHRASLHRVLRGLVFERELAVDKLGSGRQPMTYRKVRRGAPEPASVPLPEDCA
jgi:hypothetical protein